MMGYSFEEMIGQPVWKFVVEEEKARKTILAKLTGTMPPSQGFERNFRRKDGTTFPVLIRDRVLRDAQGRITGIRSTIQDITERKRAEEEMRQPCRSSFVNLRRWRPSDSWPAALPMTSTTSSPSSKATASSPSSNSRKDEPLTGQRGRDPKGRRTSSRPDPAASGLQPASDPGDEGP